MIRIRNACLVMVALSALTACDHFNKKEEPVKFGSLSHTLLMVDAEGRRYGTVEMDPVTGGRVMDVEGRVIGTIVTPTVSSTVTTVNPVVAPGTYR